VLLWQPTRHLTYLLRHTGFHLDYRAHGVSVYRHNKTKP
jgi:hypothetical protein